MMYAIGLNWLARCRRAADAPLVAGCAKVSGCLKLRAQQAAHPTRYTELRFQAALMRWIRQPENGYST
ncbi:hypothetical protein [Kingella sp. (in: b-proteobacteria)]|uniref:hypothetical protein n=1 Tax=Kingella sp. (in: b-proteobacteria) TaxID=2020713 RepID=UPI0026DCE35E|nr:hypothetical protein [Kingella sp. (in: b-proteobacteria)]MDO4657435.1 hypothetical protein [Kingella sp. (in: b-proteobacteria)]